MRAYLKFILVLFLSSSLPLAKRLYQAQARFREALCDSFDTPSAVNVLRDLVSRTNVYINSRGNDLDVSVVEVIARWVGGMLRMFGLGEGDPSDLGWGQPSQDGSTSVNVGHARHHHYFLTKSDTCSVRKW
jgi:cysteinyl-tRNA synthetase